MQVEVFSPDLSGKAQNMFEIRENPKPNERKMPLIWQAKTHNG
jgi:hypothetical protein